MTKLQLSSSPSDAAAIWPYGCLFALSLVAFSPALIFSYAMTDDYVYLWSSITGSAQGVGNNFVWSLGRVIWAISYPAIFQWIGSVEGLVWLRAVALVCVWLTACLFFSALRRSGLGTGPALVAAGLLTFSPASGLIVAWTAAANIAIANLFATAAGWCFVLQLTRSRSRANTLGIFLLHTVLLCAVLTIYQTSIGFFPLIVLALTWSRIRENLCDCLPVVYSFAAFTLSSALFTLFYWQWIVPRWGYALYQDAARFRLDFDKLVDVAYQLVYTPLSHWAWAFGPFTGITLFLIHGFWIALGLLNLGRLGRRQASLKTLCLILVAATTIGASALLSYQPTQSLSTVFGMYAVLIAIGLAECTDGVRKWTQMRKAYSWTLLSVLPLVSATVLYQDLIQINQLEYRLLRERIVEETADGIPPHMTLVTSPYVMAEAPPHWLPTQSRGLYSTTFAWVMDPAWNLILYQTQPDWLQRWRNNPHSTQLHLSPNRHHPEPSIHIFKELEGDDFPLVQDPHFDEVLAIRDSWYFSNWFGYFQRLDPHWINHPILGHFAILDRDGDHLFARSGNTDWILNSNDFPTLHIHGEPYRLDLSSYHWGQIRIQHLESGELRSFPF